MLGLMFYVLLILVVGRLHGSCCFVWLGWLIRVMRLCNLMIVHCALLFASRLVDFVDCYVDGFYLSPIRLLVLYVLFLDLLIAFLVCFEL